MLNHMLQPDTQTILLLCASFGQNRQINPQPLTLSEYNTLTNWLRDNDMTPRDLLDSTFKERLPQITIGKLDSNRLVALLERGVMLSLAVEKWTNQGLWILGRSDVQYPKFLKQKLKHLAPPILYGVGNRELLSQGGLAVVGSREVNEEELNYTRQVVQTCAQEGIQVISGGARGIDQTSMLGALEAGGNVVGVLADSLAKVAVASQYRTGIKEGKLTLICANDPNVGFNVGNAMGRNKYIYALADYALVVCASVDKGGTWAGAVEALEKIKDVSVFVRMQGTVPEGNHQLVKKGAKSFPENPWNHSLKELLAIAISEKVEEEGVDMVTVPNFQSPEIDVELTKVEGREKPTEVASSLINESNDNVERPKDIYEAVLPLIFAHLEQPKNTKSLAKHLDVRPTQMQDWLDRAVKEGKVRKNKKPVTYEVNHNTALLSLLKSVTN